MGGLYPRAAVSISIPPRHPFRTVSGSGLHPAAFFTKALLSACDRLIACGLDYIAVLVHSYTGHYGQLGAVLGSDHLLVG